MFARKTSGRVKTDRLKLFRKIFINSIIPAAKSQKGYCGAVLLIDDKSNKFEVISLWESEEDAVANEENRYYQSQLVKVMVTFADAPVREGFDVDFHDFNFNHSK